MTKQYVYLSIQRPISIGTYPQHGMVRFKNFDCRKEAENGMKAWGYLIYNRELNQTELRNYELVLIKTINVEANE